MRMTVLGGALPVPCTRHPGYASLRARLRPVPVRAARRVMTPMVRVLVRRSPVNPVRSDEAAVSGPLRAPRGGLDRSHHPRHGRPGRDNACARSSPSLAHITRPTSGHRPQRRRAAARAYTGRGLSREDTACRHAPSSAAPSSLAGYSARSPCSPPTPLAPLSPSSLPLPSPPSWQASPSPSAPRPPHSRPLHPKGECRIRRARCRRRYPNGQ